MKQHNLREELQNRSINPSLDSWEKLNSLLTAHDAKGKKGSRRFYKVASVILIFISVGFYFLKPLDSNINTPDIAAPSLKDNLNTIHEINEVTETEVTEIPETSPINKKPLPDSQMSEPNETEVALTESLTKSEVSTNKLVEFSNNDTVTGAFVVKDIPNAEVLFIDDEVEQLLNKSKIKLTDHNQGSSHKVVSANALLNSVEEDLYKDLKQKLIEKITSKLKNPKEVVTSREN